MLTVPQGQTIVQFPLSLAISGNYRFIALAICRNHQGRSITICLVGTGSAVIKLEGFIATDTQMLVVKDIPTF